MNVEDRFAEAINPEDRMHRREVRAWMLVATLVAVVLLAIIFGMVYANTKSSAANAEFREACVKSGGQPLDLTSGPTCVRSQP